MATRVSSVALPRCGSSTTFSKPEEGFRYARLVLIDIEAGTGDHPIAQSLHQRGLIDHLAARRVDQKSGPLHPVQARGIQQVPRFRAAGAMQ